MTYEFPRVKIRSGEVFVQLCFSSLMYQAFNSYLLFLVLTNIVSLFYEYSLVLWIPVCTLHDSLPNSGFWPWDCVLDLFVCAPVFIFDRSIQPQLLLSLPPDRRIFFRLNRENSYLLIYLFTFLKVCNKVSFKINGWKCYVFPLYCKCTISIWSII